MNKAQISYEESCRRECALKLVECGGPTVHGLEGYICTECAEQVLENTMIKQNLLDNSCSYCGNSMTVNTTDNFFVCADCAGKAFRTAKSWSEKHEQQPET